MPFRKPEMGEALFYAWSREDEIVTYPCVVTEELDATDNSSKFKLSYFTSQKKKKMVLEDEPVELTEVHQKLEKGQIVAVGDWCYRQAKVAGENNFKRYVPPEKTAIVPYAAAVGSGTTANNNTAGASLSFVTSSMLPELILKFWNEHFANQIYGMVQDCVNEKTRDLTDQNTALHAKLVKVQENTDVRIENSFIRHMGQSLGFPLVKMTKKNAGNNDDNGCVCRKYTFYTDNDPTRPEIKCETAVAKGGGATERSITQHQNAPFRLHSANMYEAHVGGQRSCDLSDIYCSKVDKGVTVVSQKSMNPMRLYAMCPGCLARFGASPATTAAVRTEYHNCLLCAVNCSKGKGSIETKHNDVCGKVCKDCNASLTPNQIGDDAFIRKGIVGYFKNVMGVEVEVLSEVPVKVAPDAPGGEATTLACDYCFKFTGRFGSYIFVFVENDFKAHRGVNVEKEREKTLHNFRTLTEMADASGASRMLVRVNFEKTPLLKMVMLREILAAMVRDQRSFPQRGSILYLFYEPDNKFVVKHLAPWCVLNRTCAFSLGDDRPNWSSDPSSALFLHGSPTLKSESIVPLATAFQPPIADKKVSVGGGSGKRKR